VGAAKQNSGFILGPLLAPNSFGTGNTIVIETSFLQIKIATKNQIVFKWHLFHYFVLRFKDSKGNARIPKKRRL
jgi:hypothetical protein